MKNTAPIWVFVCVAAACAQTGPPYVINTYAGSYNIADNGPAVQGLLYLPYSAALDRLGNLYIADALNHRVRKVSSGGTITTLAGTGVPGYGGDGKPATEAQLRTPTGVAVDQYLNVYIADTDNNRIRKVDANGIISTVAGGQRQGFGGDNGSATAASLFLPRGVAVDSAGNIYIADTRNNRIRKVSGGVITTLAGNGTKGYAGENSPATAAQLNEPQGVAVDTDGNVYIADSGNHRLRMVSEGVIRTLVGTGRAGFNGDRVGATLTQVNEPQSVAVDPQRNVYFADTGNWLIRKVTPQGVVTTEVGNGRRGPTPDETPASDTGLLTPGGVAVDITGRLYVVDTGNHRVLSIIPRDPVKFISKIVAGRSHGAGDGGQATSADLFFPRGLWMDSGRNLFVADTQNFKVRKITPEGVISTVAGNGTAGTAEDGVRALSSPLASPTSVAVGPDGAIYIAEPSSHVVRKVTPDGQMSFFAGTTVRGATGDQDQARFARLDAAEGLAVDTAGNVYIADTNNDVIRRVRLNGIIERIAGTYTAGTGPDTEQPATSVALRTPRGLALDSAGNLYIADTGNNRVRRLTPDGLMKTVAGGGTSRTDGVPATSAALRTPVGLAVDRFRNLYITEWGASTGGDRVRQVLFDGTIRTLAGTSTPGFSGDGGPAARAQINGPAGIAVNETGDIFFSDSENSRIRKLTLVGAADMVIAGGNNQKGGAGSTLAQPLSVRVTGVDGAALSGIPVSFEVIQGGATLSDPLTVTGADGRASTKVTLPAVEVAVVVLAATPGLPAVRFELAVSGPPVAEPRIAVRGVVGAGLSVPPVEQISSNALVAILGENLANDARELQPSEVANGRYPTKLAGVCVRMGASLASLVAVRPERINAIVPRFAGSGAVSIQVLVNCGDANEVKSAAYSVQLEAASPEFFYFEQNSDGKNPVRAADSATGEPVGGSFAPAQPGHWVTLFGTGFGATTPNMEPGALASGQAGVNLPATVTLGETQLSGADVSYIGVTPGEAGVYQVNLHIPDDAPDGDLALKIQIGDFASPPGAYLRVKRPPPPAAEE